jgi:hypothetical protein
MENPSVENFKRMFPRNFPYLKIWQAENAYKEGAEVYHTPDENFYRSTVDNNIEEPPNPDFWERITDSVNNYITDDQIEKAIEEARFIFREDLFQDREKMMAWLYLAAHFLVVDIRNITGGVNSAPYFIESHKRAGSVEVSYAIPSGISSNPLLSGLMTTGFGQKYLTMAYPRSVAHMMLLKGWTTP